MSKRAERRHHYQRLKAKRKDYWINKNWTWISDEDMKIRIALTVNTPKRCSCDMCGNQRNAFWGSKKNLTNQELKAEVDFDEQVDEYYD
jgi:hypothetical protein